MGTAVSKRRALRNEAVASVAAKVRGGVGVRGEAKHVPYAKSSTVSSQQCGAHSQNIVSSQFEPGFGVDAAVATLSALPLCRGVVHAALYF
uniref:Uncharacterized protein n=1 Tax=Sphaerodactylus townsendi TaxID=933632 RepID=A0ACB8EZ39_9SAUR